MKLIVALKKLQDVGIPVMTTADVACRLKVTNPHASQMLKRLSQEKLVTPLRKGVWVVDQQVNPLAIPDYLVSPFPCYISLQTALYHHGLIDQIPRVVSVVSLSRTKLIPTQLATYSIHHIQPEFFFDYESDIQTGVKMASPEKALLDFFYLKPAKSSWFKVLPEIEIESSFNVKRALEMIQKIPSPRRRVMVEREFRSCLRLAFADQSRYSPEG